jgi:hypothetical protein
MMQAHTLELSGTAAREVSAQDVSFSSPPLAPGGLFKGTFPKPGT